MGLEVLYNLAQTLLHLSYGGFKQGVCTVYLPEKGKLYWILSVNELVQIIAERNECS